MRKLIHVIILIIFTACGSSPDYQEVMVNKTVKVYSQDYHNEAENYTFKWEPPKGPSKNAISFDLKNDMLIFSPDIEGDYQIHLSITDISDEVIAEEMFYYRAIAETLEVAIAKIIPEEEIPPPPSVVKKPEKKKPAKSDDKEKRGRRRRISKGPGTSGGYSNNRGKGRGRSNTPKEEPTEEEIHSSAARTSRPSPRNSSAGRKYSTDPDESRYEAGQI